MDTIEFTDAMSREFVPYEIAMELKALGFNEPCFGMYFSALKRDTDEPIKCLSISDVKEQDCYSGQECSAPIWQQAFRFLRKKYEFMHAVEDIMVQVASSPKKGYRFRWTVWKILDIYQNLWVDETILGCLTVEDANLAAMKKMIELAKI